MKLNNKKHLPFVLDLAKREKEPFLLYLLGTIQGRLKKSDWQREAKAKREAKKRNQP